MSFSSTNVMTPLNTITHRPASACQRSSVQLPCRTPALPGRSLAPPTPMYSSTTAGSANTPTSRPPINPAIPWV